MKTGAISVSNENGIWELIGVSNENGSTKA